MGRCHMATPKRNMVVLGVGTDEFLVRAGGSEEDVRQGLRKLLPDISFELKAVASQTAKRLEARLSSAQLALLKRLHSKAGVKSTKGLGTYRLRLAGGGPTRQVVATATANARLTFRPRISEI